MLEENRPTGSRSVVLASLATFLIMFLVPILPYGALSALAGLEPPGNSESPAQFMLAVVVMKVGVALGFVLIFHAARASLRGRWLAYAGAWFLMYVIVEIGQAIGPGYSWLEAGGGIVAEAFYFPMSAWVVDRMLGT